MELFKIFGSIAVKNDQANKAIDQSAGKAEGFGSKLKSGIGTAAKWGTAIVGGAVAAGAGMVEFAEKSAATADNVDKMSQRLGLSKKGFQEWQYVLSQSGVDINSMQTGMKTLTNTIGDAKNGTKAAVEKFKALGITQKDLATKSREDIFGMTVKGLQGLKNGTDKAAMANDMFGKSGQEIIPLLNETAAGTEALKKKANDLGMVMSDSTVKSGVQLTDTLDTLKRTGGAIVTKLGASLMPILQKVAQGIIDKAPKIQAFIAKFEPVFSKVFSKILPPLVNMCEQLLPVLMDLIGALIPPISDILTSLLPPITNLLTMILVPVGKIVEQLLPPLLSMLKPLFTLLQPIIDLLQPIMDMVMKLIQPLLDLLNLILPPLIQLIMFIANSCIQQIQPIINWLADFLGGVLSGVIDGITATIKGCADGFISAWNGIKSAWSVVCKFFEGIWNGIKSTFASVGKWFKGIFESAAKAIHTVVDPWIQIFSKIWAKIAKVFEPVVNFFKKIFSDAWAGIKRVFEPVAHFFGNIWKGIKQEFSQVTNWFKNVFSEAWGAVKKVFSAGGKVFDGIKDGIVSVFKTVVNAIIKGINKVVALPFKAINALLSKLKSLKIMGIAPFGWIKTLPVPQIPLLKKGGVLKKGQTGYLEGDGAEAVVPLEENTKWARNIAEKIHEFSIKQKSEIDGMVPTERITSAIKSEVGARLQQIQSQTTLILMAMQKYYPELLSAFDVTMVMDGDTIAAKLAPKMDTALGDIYAMRARGTI